MYSTPSRMVHPIYSSANSPNISYPYSPTQSKFIRNPIYFSPNPIIKSHTVSLSQAYDPITHGFDPLSQGFKPFSQSIKPITKRIEVIPHKDQEKEDFMKKEQTYIDNLDFLKKKLGEVLEENGQLNRMVRSYQQGGLELHRETGELEAQIKYLLEENEKLAYNSNNNISQQREVYQEIEAFNEEKALCQAKIDELHEKLTLIFEDNDRLSNVLKEREDDFEKLQKIYEREAKLRVEIQKKYENMLEDRGYEHGNNEEIKDFIEENKKLREMLQEQERFTRDLEGKVELLIQENEKLNGIFQQKKQQMMNSNETIEEFSNVNKGLTEDNLRLTEVLTEKLKELEALEGVLKDYKDKDDEEK